jgi:hypothetical protein
MNDKAHEQAQQHEAAKPADKALDKVARHAEEFANFWLGMVGAGARGVAEALGKPDPINKKAPTIEDRLQHTVDRAARGFRAAFEQAAATATATQENLEKLHAHKGKLE